MLLEIKALFLCVKIKEMKKNITFLRRKFGTLEKSRTFVFQLQIIK